MPNNPTTNFKDSNQVDLGDKLVTKDYLLEIYGSILENSPASGLIVTPELWGWGHGRYLAIFTNDNRSTPVTVFSGGTNWKQVTCGNTYSAAIKTDGTLWNWFNDVGTPITTMAGGNNWKSITAGNNYRAAIKTDGSLWLWGANSTYTNVGSRLGINDTSTTSRATPVTTFAGENNWKSVACGYDHSAAIKTDGSLWVWGNNSDGQLGINNTTHMYTPVTTFAGGNTWKSVSVGRAITGAVKTDGSLWAWGSSGAGGIGNGAVVFFGQVRTPVTTFAGGNTWKSVSCGSSHMAAIKTDGTLWTWGANDDGQLGINNTTSPKSTPVTTFAGGNNWKSVACGYSRKTAAIKTDGTLWIWGQNNNASLGINATGNRSTPVTTFAGGNDWKQVAPSIEHTHAIKSIDYI